MFEDDIDVEENNEFTNKRYFSECSFFIFFQDKFPDLHIDVAKF